MLHFNFFNCHLFFQLYCWTTHSLWQIYCHQLWRTKLMFWNYSSGLWDHHNLNSWSTQGRKNKLGFKAYYHSQEKEMDVRGSGWPNNVKSETVLPTSLSENLSDQAVALDGHIVFLADRMQDYSRKRRGGLCVYVIDAWRTYSVDGQCIPLNF